MPERHRNFEIQAPSPYIDFCLAMKSSIKTIAIIGGGPAGATLGTLLAKQGYKAAIYHTDKRPPLIVGESLLPAVVPMIRKLGIEDEVKSFSVHKPGATVCLGVQEVITAFFKWADGRLPDYAYNTPRDLFDQAVLNAAGRGGAKIIHKAGRLQKGPAPDTVELSPESLEAAEGFLGNKPDLIVDASGRLRLIARLLDSPAKKGGRDDVALFAHLDKIFISDPGNIHIDHLTAGWSWRIPLPGRTSLGIVINPRHLEKYGPGIEEQYDAFLAEEPSLKFYSAGAKRLTPVVKYQNYQLISERMYGPGWVMAGDAAGFIDPVFSTGLYLGMKGAFEVMKAIESGSPGAMKKYENGRHWELRMWQRVIDSWYSGRLFNLYRAGQKLKDAPMGKLMSRRVQKRLLRIFSGQAVDDFYALQLFEYLISFGQVLRDPRDLVVA
jgi:flavin-dependent dehydrogenase